MPKVAAAFGELGSAFSVTGLFAPEASEPPDGPFASARFSAAAAALPSCAAGAAAAAATRGREAPMGRIGSREAPPPEKRLDRPPPPLPGTMGPMVGVRLLPKAASVLEAIPIDPCSGRSFPLTSPLALAAGAARARAGASGSTADASPDLHALAAASGASSTHTRIAARLRAERRSIPVIATPLLSRMEQARLPASPRSRFGRVTRWKGLRHDPKVPEAIASLLVILRARGVMCG